MQENLRFCTDNPDSSVTAFDMQGGTFAVTCEQLKRETCKQLPTESICSADHRRTVGPYRWPKMNSVVYLDEKFEGFHFYLRIETLFAWIEFHNEEYDEQTIRFNTLNFANSIMCK